MKGVLDRGITTSNELFEMVWEEIQNKGLNKIPGIKELLEMLLNAIMMKEREVYLQRHPEDRANGFYERRLGLRFSEVDLKVPRVRFGRQFRPTILPPHWKRVDRDYEELLLGMLANGYSKSQMKQSLKRLGLSFSDDALEAVVELVKEKLEYFKQRSLKSDWLCVFIDAYHGGMRIPEGRVVEVSIFVAVGIDLDGQKHLLGFWVLRGRENKGFWIEVLQDLISRGLHKVLLFVTDDFSGLTGVIKELFPGTEHQLCLVHLRRALKRKLQKSLYSKISRALHRLRHAEDAEEGRQIMKEVVDVVSEQDSRYGKMLQNKTEHYIAFLKYPRQIRGHLYTTNPVEGLNAGLELMRLELGGYFPSQDCLEVNLFIQAVNLEDRWQRKAMPKVVSCLYEIRQMFQLRYGLNEDGTEE